MVDVHVVLAGYGLVDLDIDLDRKSLCQDLPWRGHWLRYRHFLTTYLFGFVDEEYLKCGQETHLKPTVAINVFRNQKTLQIQQTCIEAHSSQILPYLLSSRKFWEMKWS